MPEYRVEWVIEVDADTPEDAARRALEMMQDPQSTANVFNVMDKDGIQVEIDLEHLNENNNGAPGAS